MHISCNIIENLLRNTTLFTAAYTLTMQYLHYFAAISSSNVRLIHVISFIYNILPNVY